MSNAEAKFSAGEKFDKKVDKLVMEMADRAANGKEPMTTKELANKLSELYGSAKQLQETAGNGKRELCMRFERNFQEALDALKASDPETHKKVVAQLADGAFGNAGNAWFDKAKFGQGMLTSLQGMALFNELTTTPEKYATETGRRELQNRLTDIMGQDYAEQTLKCARRGDGFASKEEVKNNAIDIKRSVGDFAKYGIPKLAINLNAMLKMGDTEIGASFRDFAKEQIGYENLKFLQGVADAQQNVGKMSDNELRSELTQLVQGLDINSGRMENEPGKNEPKYTDINIGRMAQQNFANLAGEIMGHDPENGPYTMTMLRDAIPNMNREQLEGVLLAIGDPFVGPPKAEQEAQEQKRNMSAKSVSRVDDTLGDASQNWPLSSLRGNLGELAGRFRST